MFYGDLHAKMGELKDNLAHLVRAKLWKGSIVSAKKNLGLLFQPEFRSRSFLGQCKNGVGE